MANEIVLPSDQMYFPKLEPSGRLHHWPRDMKVLVASTTPIRFEALESVRSALGLTCDCIVTNAMPEEPDADPVEVAQRKVLHVLERLRADRYTDRRDDRFTFILSADSVNIGNDGLLRGKAGSVATMERYVAEWERSASEDVPQRVKSGYALLVYHAHSVVMYTQSDEVQLKMRRPGLVEEWMYPIAERYYEHSGIAHGFPTEKAFHKGDIVILDMDGNELQGLDGLNRVRGASPTHIMSLFEAAYIDLVKMR